MTPQAPRLETLAELALACVQREFPYQPGHVLRSASDLARPRALHPAFYGCYDWHSAVHGHWLLAFALKRSSDPALENRIVKVLDENLAGDKLQAEAGYLEANPWFERPYGWAWALKLALEVQAFPGWSSAMAPLAAAIERRYLEWLPKQGYPIRSGTHANTAFGLAFALDYARAMKRTRLEEVLVEKALAWYGEDRNYPAAWEPGGNDFFSPCLVEADLMRRVVPDFERWFRAFLPGIPKVLGEPARVSERGDGQLVHLDGLNLSRAWCFYNLGLPEAGDRHFAAGCAQLASGHYEGEHWLATFAAYAAACALEGATTTPAARNTATWRE